MATRLELCRRLAKEADISGAANGTLPASTTSQTGEMLSVVTWTDDAYEDIQNQNAGKWDFLLNDFTFATISGTSTYTITDAGLAEHNDWKNETCEDVFTCYLTATGVSDEQWMEFVPWDDFKKVYRFGASRTQTGRPSIYTIKSDKSVMFWPIPNASYTITGQYWKRPHRMTTDADATTGTPIFPRQFHQAIMWRALMLYGGFETASAVYAHAKQEYGRLMIGLRNDQLPAIEMVGSFL